MDASTADEEEAAPAPAPAPYELLQLVTTPMDCDTKSVWRLVSRATCHAVYASTTGLRPRRAAIGDTAGTEGMPHITSLPLPLLGKCGGLRRLLCSGATKLASIRGLPCGLEVLEMDKTAVADLSPLRRCCGLRQLSADGVAALRMPDGWTELRAALACMPGLQRLELGGRTGIKAMQVVAPALAALCEMQQLGISFVSVDEEGARALAPALASMPRLQRLSLSLDDLSAAAAATLAPPLATLTALTVLDLSHNALGPEGARSLAPTLAALTALQRLDLSANSLGPDGARALAPALPSLTRLHVLNLSFNWMGVMAAQALEPLLLKITSLQKLDLRRNNLLTGGSCLAPLMNRVGLVVMLDHNPTVVGTTYDDDWFDDDDELEGVYAED